MDMKSKIMTRAMAVFLAFILSFTLVIPSTFATDDANSKDNISIEIINESENEDIEKTDSIEPENDDNGEILDIENTDIETDVILENYIRNNADNIYIGTIDKMSVVNVLYVKNTLFNGNLVRENDTIDSIMEAIENDANLDAMNKLIAQIDGVVAMYDVNSDSDYLVAYANTMMDVDAYVQDYEFAINNTSGSVVNGCHYDTTTGLVYIPKDLYKNGDEYNLGSIQVQFMQVIGSDYSDLSSSVDSSIYDAESNANDVNIYETVEDIFSMETTVQTETGLNENKMLVSVNGVPIDDTEFEYNSNTGEITLEQSSASILSVSVTVEDEETIASTIDTYSDIVTYGVNNYDELGMVPDRVISIPDWVTTGTALYGYAPLAYRQVTYNPGTSYASDYVYHFGYSNLTALYNKITQNIDSSVLNTQNLTEAEGQFLTVNIDDDLYSCYNTSTKTYEDQEGNTLAYYNSIGGVANIANGSVTDGTQIEGINSLSQLYLECSHVARNGDASWWETLTGDNYSDSDKSIYTDVYIYKPVMMRFLYLDDADNYAVFGLFTGGIAAQNGIGVYKVSTSGTEGQLNLQKTSSNTTVTDGNSCYSYEGAQYGVYKDSSCTVGTEVATLITDADGVSQTVTLDAGTYYVKELAKDNNGNSYSKGYKVDENTYEVSVTGGGTAKYRIEYNPDTDLWQAYLGDQLIEDFSGIATNTYYPFMWYLHNGAVDFSYNQNIGGTYGWKIDNAGVYNSNFVTTSHSSGFELSDDNSFSGRLIIGDDRVIQLYEYASERYNADYTNQYANLASFEAIWGGSYNNSSLMASDRISTMQQYIRESLQFRGYCDVYLVAAVNDQTESGINNMINLANTLSNTSATFNGQTEFPTIHIVNLLGYSNQGASGVSSFNSALASASSQYGFDVTDITSSLSGGASQSGYDSDGTWAQDTCLNVWAKILETNSEAVGTVATLETVASIEPPGDDPISLIVQKDPKNISAEDAPSLAGAQFTIKYYNNRYDNVSDLPSEATWTWVIETKYNPYGKNYEAGLDEECIVESLSSPLYIGNSGQISIPYGTITIQETKTPDGFSDDGAWSSQTINGVTTTTGLPQDIILYNVEDLGDVKDLTVNYTREDPVDIWGGLTVPKIDMERDYNVPQGDATLAGAEYTIYYNGDESVTYTDKKTGQEVTITPDEPVITIVTDEDGYATTAGSPNVAQSSPVLGDINATTDNTLLYGRYYVKETKASTGYLLNESFRYDFFVGAETDENGNVVRDSDGAVEFVENAITVSSDGAEQVIRGGFEINKRDLESGRNVAEGGASLKNAELTLINESDYSVMVGAESLEEYLSNPEKYTYEPGEVIMVLYTNDDGWAGVDGDTLPYGTYKIVETQSPEGYLPHDQYKENDKDNGETVGVLEREFVIRTDGEIVDLTDQTYDFNINDYVSCAESGDAIYNQVIRADFAIRKIDSDTQKKMAGVIFKIESVTTGEYHYFMTDENGAYSSAVDYADHTHNTNYHDDESTWDETDIDGLENHCGMWFYGYDDPDSTKIDNSLGALPYDTYKVTEITTEANEDYIPWSDTFTVGPNDNNLVVDLNDIENTKMYLDTTATLESTDSQYGPATAYTTVIDAIAYENLEIGHTYTFVSKLYDLNTMNFVTNEDGSDIFGITQVTPRTHFGTTKAEFEFDATDCAGDDIVIFEYVYDGDEVIGSPILYETDPTEANQTLHLSGIGTEALDEETGNNLAYADDTVTIIDTIEYTNLVPNREYEVTGTLMDKDTKEPVLDPEGNMITVTTTEVANESGSGEWEVEFTFDATGMEGTTIVVFEYVYYKGVEFAVHADINDEPQTVYMPKIHTMAWSADTGTNIGVLSDEHDTVTLYDTVWYSGLKPDSNYHVFGVLLDAETREAELDADGNEIYGDYAFTAEETSGTLDVEYNVDTSQLEGRKTVFFEVLYHVDYDEDGNAIYTLVAEEDIAEAEQESLYFPDIHTNAWDKETGEGVLEPHEETILVDTITYTHLAPDHEYTVTGVLMNKETGEPVLDAEGNEITSEATFTPEESEGTVDVEFVFDTTGLEGSTFVVFENLYYEDIELAVHADIEDEDQSVYIPKIHTEALDSATNDHISMADDSITIIDTVEYTNLKPGLEYTMNGTLMDKETGMAMVDDNGQEITATATFTPDTADGTVDIEFTFSGVSLAGKTLVAFESVEYQEVEVATHADLEDEDQTVYVPEIHTTAVDQSTNSHEVTTDGTVTIVDTVEYTNLIPGKEYTMKGELMDELTGDALNITSETTFTPETANGSVDMTFTFNANDVGDTTVVVFEECYIETEQGTQELVAEHKDMNDTNQQVTINIPTPKETTTTTTTTTTTPTQSNPTSTTTGTTPAKTGEIIGFSTLAAVIVAAGVVLIVTVSKRKKTDTED